ncbi:prion protein b precursor [Danio rerio]|uniref:Prion protein 1 n=1 Tax=Danio rerio TaxID=7955 RepID=Q3BDW0_DANRE|nr:prion protein b precursor [Danio rerio]AAS00159.1 prion protein 1 [Danio rerio]|eukprot:NP_001013315.2 prion protein b precursor [Danio rerio]
MGELCKLLAIVLVLMAVLHYTSGGKKGTVSKTVPKKPPEKTSQGTKTQPNYPRQPSNPGAGSNPGYPNQQYPGRGGSSPSGYPNQNPGAGSYPAGGSYPYPGRGGSSPGGYPNQNPGAGSYPSGGSYPSAGGNPNQYPGRGGYNPGGYPNQNPGAGSYPAGGSYPSAGGNPNQYPGRGGTSPAGYPNQNPGAGSYPAGGSYPSAGGNPNQYPGRGGSNPGGYPNQNPGAGSYPAGGSYPSAGGNPNQYPGRGGSSPGGNPNQNPGAGTYAGGGYPNQYPGGGGYSNQNPGRSGYSPGGYPGAGSYPVRNAGQPGVYPGAHPSAGGGYPNWNPNNQILSPRYGGPFGGGGFGTGGSPFSQSVKNMGYNPSAKSKGFGKKAVVAAGVGAMAGMAIGYGIGNFQRPNFQFRSPQEERYYNNHMYQRQDTRFKDGGNKKKPSHTAGTDNTSKLPAQAQSYDNFMKTCMKRNNLLRDQDSKESAGNSNIQRDEPMSDFPGLNEESSQKGGPEKNDTTSNTTTRDYPKAADIHKNEDEETVSIMQIGYPALIEQMKSRKCVELYIVYSESQRDDRMEKREGKIPRSSNNHNGHSISEVLLLLTASTMLFSTT